MAAVVDGGAGFGRVVHGAEVLPFARAHFGAGLGGAGWGVGEEGDDDGVGFLDQEAAELVEPDVFGGVGGWGGKLFGDVGGEGVGGQGVGGVGMGVVQGFEVFG